MSYTENNFLDDLKTELIEDNPEYKILLDYIEGRIKQAVQHTLDNIEFATKEDIQEMIDRL